MMISIWFLAVLLQELGYVAVGRLCGARVKRVCLCYDPLHFSWRLGCWNGVEYCIGWVPWGGYVTMEFPDGKPAWRLNLRELLRRVAKVLAGPVVALLMGYVGFFGWERYYEQGEEKPYTWSQRATLVHRVTMYEARHAYGNLVNYVVNCFPKEETPGRPVVTKQNLWPKGLAAEACLRIGVEGGHRATLLFASMNILLLMVRLLPFAPLNGGRLWLLLYEAATRREAGPWALMGLTLAGVGLLMACLGSLFPIPVRWIC